MHIKKSIEEIFCNQPNDSWQLSLLKNWDSMIGQLKSKVQLEKINNETLILGVYDSCWMQELYLLSNLIINKINSNLDKPRIKAIRFKQASRKKKVSVVEKKVVINKKIELSQNELYALNKIKDPQLSEVLKSFLIKCHQQKD